MKICSKCKAEKPESNFVTDKGRRCKPHSWCKDCEDFYRQSDKSQDARLAIKRYWASPKGKLKRLQRTRRRRDMSNFSSQDAIIVHERFDNRCFNCQNTGPLEIDHHYPLSRGYKLTLDNAVLLCRSCNCRKHDQMPQEFYSADQLLRLSKILKISVDAQEIRCNIEAQAGGRPA